MRYNTGVKKLFIVYLLVTMLFAVSPAKALAADPDGDTCSSWNVTVLEGVNTSFTSGSKDSHTVSLDVSSLPQGDSYYLGVYDAIAFDGSTVDLVEVANSQKPSGGRLTFTLTNNEALNGTGDYDDIFVFLGVGTGGPIDRMFGDFCYAGMYTITQDVPSCDDIFVSQNRDGDQCYSSGCIEKGTVNVQVTGIKNPDGSYYTGPIEVKIKKDGFNIPDQDKNQTPVNGSVTTTHTVGESGSYTVTAQLATGANLNCPQPSFNVEPMLCDDTDPLQCGGKTSALEGETTTPFQLCAQINDPAQYSSCVECAGGAEGVASGVWTAVGCIPTNATSIVQSLIKIGLSVAGGVALLMILAAGFIFSTSQGDPKRTNEAKELMTSAIIGLLFIIFSVTMLQFIGVNVLRIPGFGTP